MIQRIEETATSEDTTTLPGGPGSYLSPPSQLPPAHVNGVMP
jgi:hypothetical protein